jgi:hypothetical protein
VVQSCRPLLGGIKFGHIAPFKVMMWYLNFNGRMVKLRQHEVTIAPFKSEYELTSLNPCLWLWPNFRGADHERPQTV